MTFHKIILLFFIVLGTETTACQSPYGKTEEDTLAKNKKQHLWLKGIIKQTKLLDKSGGKPLSNAIITVYNESNTLVASCVTEKKGKCEIKLPLNRHFTIEISKEGYVSKRLEIDTHLPPEKKVIYVFPFEVSIFEKVEGLDVSILKTPVARIIYNKDDSQFAYDMEFTNRINEELKKLYNDYYLLNKK